MTPPQFDFDDRPDARYCPSCAQAFRPEIERCPDCDQRLLRRDEAKRLAREAPSEPGEIHSSDRQGMDLPIVATLGNPVEIARVSEALMEAGIPHHIEHHLASPLGVADSLFGANLRVAEEHAASTRSILAGLEPDLDTCPTEEDPGIGVVTDDENVEEVTTVETGQGTRIPQLGRTGMIYSALILLFFVVLAVHDRCNGG